MAKRRAVVEGCFSQDCSSCGQADTEHWGGNHREELASRKTVDLKFCTPPMRGYPRCLDPDTREESA
ncbi:hypothetical protein [Aliiroseovarius crassostreae]|uniref:hypothetical protein n=1 Tax=Aliiroseovarius crassostreae TaxID=154981 RepID=UPI00137914A0|nr:hypothetical protein [Aliiroseovarius crassostreae]